MPAILPRTPYNNWAWRDPYSHAHFFLVQGMVLPVQDHHGRFASDGDFVPCTYLDQGDGNDTVTGSAWQGRSSVRVGTFGWSYLGDVQADLATA